MQSLVWHVRGRREGAGDVSKREGVHYDLQHSKYLKRTTMECSFS